MTGSLNASDMVQTSSCVSFSVIWDSLTWKKIKFPPGFFLRKLKPCIWRTLRGMSRCRTSWSPNEKPTRGSGPRWEPRWPWCGWKGEDSLCCWGWWLERLEFQAASPLQGSPFHPDSPAEPGGWREGREQPQLNSSERHQSVRAGAEEIPRLDCPEDLQCERTAAFILWFSWGAAAGFGYLFLFCVRRLLQAVLFAAPYRSNFFKALSKGEDVSEDDCLAKVRQFLENYTPTVDAIYEMYTSLNAELDYTVWCSTSGTNLFLMSALKLLLCVWYLFDSMTCIFWFYNWSLTF